LGKWDLVFAKKERFVNKEFTIFDCSFESERSSPLRVEDLEYVFKSVTKHKHRFGANAYE